MPGVCLFVGVGVRVVMECALVGTIVVCML